MAQITVYADIIRGFIEYTGNTVQMRNASNAESQCAISPGPPSGTFTATTAWRTNGSAAFLTGLTGSTVLKAYLAWMGTPVPDANGSSTNQNIAVTFATPTASVSVSPNAAWSQNNNVVAGQQFNIRVADVTSYVTSGGLGQYSVTGIPSGSNYTGWTLAVVWQNSALPPRYISVYTYDDLVGVSSSSLALTVSGFITPGTGTVTAQNVIFKDTLPNGTVLVSTSVYVNGVQQSGASPSTGVTIPNIAPGQTATITFSVQVQC